MGSRPTMQSLQATLETLVNNQVTKEYFDTKIGGLEKRIDNQDGIIANLKTKVETVEKDNHKMPDTIYKEIHEQEARKKNLIIFRMKLSISVFLCIFFFVIAILLL